MLQVLPTLRRASSSGRLARHVPKPHRPRISNADWEKHAGQNRQMAAHVQAAPSSLLALYTSYYKKLPSDRVTHSVKEVTMHELVFVDDEA